MDASAEYLNIIYFFISYMLSTIKYFKTPARGIHSVIFAGKSAKKTQIRLLDICYISKYS